MDCNTSPAWKCWHEAVKKLVGCADWTLSLFKNPQTPIDIDQFQTGLMSIETSLMESAAAAKKVGGKAERLRVSKTLERIHSDSVSLAERMLEAKNHLMPNNNLNEFQKWHTVSRLRIEPLQIKLHSRDIDLEMEEANENQEGEKGVEKPQWDGSTLTVRGRTKRYSQQAHQQRAFLEAFQKAGWPSRIDNPLRSAQATQQTKTQSAALKSQLRKAIDNLNRAMRNCKPPLLIVFVTDGIEGVTWEWGENKPELRRS